MEHTGGEAGTDYVRAPSASVAMGFDSLVFSSAALATDVPSWLDNPATDFGWLLRIEDEAPLVTASRIATPEDTANAPVLTIDCSVPSPPTPPDLFDFALISGDFRFSFNGEEGRSYTVQFRDSFSSGTWERLTNIATLPEPVVLHLTNAANGDARYFRVRTP